MIEQNVKVQKKKQGFEDKEALNLLLWEPHSHVYILCILSPRNVISEFTLKKLSKVYT